MDHKKEQKNNSKIILKDYNNNDEMNIEKELKNNKLYEKFKILEKKKNELFSDI